MTAHYCAPKTRKDQIIIVIPFESWELVLDSYNKKTQIVDWEDLGRNVLTDIFFRLASPFLKCKIEFLPMHKFLRILLISTSVLTRGGDM